MLVRLKAFLVKAFLVLVSRRRRCAPAIALLLACGAVHAGEARLPEPTGPIILTVTGAVERTNRPGSAVFDETLLGELPRHRIETTTPWTDGRRVFEGVRLGDLLDHVGASAAQTLSARALNDYRVSFPAADARRHGALLALRMDGRPLQRRDKGPIWIVYPRDGIPEIQDERYDHRWIWQLDSIDIR